MTEYRDTKNVPEQVVEVGNPSVPTISEHAHVPGIIDAVRDNLGGIHYRYGTTVHSIWFSLSELMNDEKATFLRLSPIQRLITRIPRDAFRKAVEVHDAFREGLVAAAPGWTGNHFVLGNGKVVSWKGSSEEVIVTFQALPKFNPHGTFKTWRKQVGPIVAKQPIPLGCLCLALAGPLMRFVPPDYISPMIELIGKRESGKTTAAILAASVWAGRGSKSKIGGAESWKTTVAALDATMARHRDGLLVLDEANLIGTDPKLAGPKLSDAVMTLVSPQPKNRYGDVGTELHADLAILSTSNQPLRKMFEGDPDVIDAVESRSMPILVKKQGMLAITPIGYESTGKAIRELRRTSSACYGTLGPRFVERLIAEAMRNEDAFGIYLSHQLEELENTILGLGKLKSDRHVKIFCLLALVAKLATDWKCFSSSWDAETSILTLYKAQLLAERASKARIASACIERYARVNRLINPHIASHDPATCDVNNVPGFQYAEAGTRRILIGVKQFRQAFRNSAAVLKELAKAGHLKTEGGKAPKSTIKAPVFCANKGRVYCIILPDPKKERRRVSH